MCVSGCKGSSEAENKKGRREQRDSQQVHRCGRFTGEAVSFTFLPGEPQVQGGVAFGRVVLLQPLTGVL